MMVAECVTPYPGFALLMPTPTQLDAEHIARRVVELLKQEFPHIFKEPC